MKPLKELRILLNKLPLDMQTEISNKVAEWLASGGSEDSVYIEQQLRYVENFLAITSMLGGGDPRDPLKDTHQHIARVEISVSGEERSSLPDEALQRHIEHQVEHQFIKAATDKQLITYSEHTDPVRDMTTTRAEMVMMSVADYRELMGAVSALREQINVNERKGD